MAHAREVDLEGDPTDPHVEVWRSVLRAHREIKRCIEVALEARVGLSFGEYEVLVNLLRAPGHRLRLGELAAAVVYTRAGLTKVAHRLVERGLVAREASTEDGRGAYAVLTPRGTRTVRTAKAEIAEVVRARIGPVLDPDEIGVARDLLDRLAYTRPPVARST